MQTYPDHRHCLPTNFSAPHPHLLSWVHVSAFACTLHTHTHTHTHTPHTQPFSPLPVMTESISVNSRETKGHHVSYPLCALETSCRQEGKSSQKGGFLRWPTSMPASQQFPLLFPFEYLAVCEQILLTLNLKKCGQKFVQPKLSPVHTF